MKVILITTSTNAVRHALEQSVMGELLTIDSTLPKNKMFRKLEQLLSNITPDILITYRCPYILPKYIFCQARLGAYNIHPSLLPKYPGLNPWDAIFRNHEQEGGVTLHQITEQIDTGTILYQSSFLIEDCDTIDSARTKADLHAAELVRLLINGISS